MRQDLVIASVLAGLGVALLPAVLAFYLAAGPMLWMVTGGAVTAFGLAFAYNADPADGSAAAAGDSRPSKTNCSDCGSRVLADAATCEYCNARLDS